MTSLKIHSHIRTFQKCQQATSGFLLWNFIMPVSTGQTYAAYTYCSNLLFMCFTGVIRLGGERTIRWKVTGAQGSLRLGGDRWSLEMQSEDRIAPSVWAMVEVKELSSVWPLCFSKIQHKPLYLTLGFYYYDQLEFMLQHIVWPWGSGF